LPESLEVNIERDIDGNLVGDTSFTFRSSKAVDEEGHAIEMSFEGLED
jgi:hypothetical protein